MPSIRVAVSDIINAPAEQVYTILADYQNHHPHILPKAFSGVEIEQGGYGAGTVLQVHTQALGIKQTYHMQVTEPEPGRVLAETDLKTGLVTTFRVVPRGNQQAEVTIATEWDSQPGLKGLLERFINPLFMRRIYRQELQNLDHYARQKR
jgi:hypothetical protein